jgi:hypothetical protein
MNLCENLLTIIQFLEERVEAKEQRRREEGEREEEEREERRQQQYHVEAEEGERRQLTFLELKEKAHQEHYSCVSFEQNKKLKSVPTWNNNDTPTDFLR